MSENKWLAERLKKTARGCGHWKRYLSLTGDFHSAAARVLIILEINARDRKVAFQFVE